MRGGGVGWAKSDSSCVPEPSRRPHHSDPSNLHRPLQGAPSRPARFTQLLRVSSAVFELDYGAAAGIGGDLAAEATGCAKAKASQSVFRRAVRAAPTPINECAMFGRNPCWLEYSCAALLMADGVSHSGNCLRSTP